MNHLDLSKRIIKKQDGRGFAVVDFAALYENWHPDFAVWYNEELIYYTLILGNFHHLITERTATKIIKDKQLIKYKFREGSFSYDTKETIRERLSESIERKKTAIKQIAILEKHINYLKGILGNES